jgi:glycosyltransferase involved in cell wall biosynthesis
MVSFQDKLVDGLTRRGLETCQDLKDTPYQAVLVIGGTRDLAGLWRARRQGIPLVQRLDGMNWLHRLAGVRRDGWRHYLRAEYGNRLLAFIRRRLADRLIYQSQFARQWWENVRGKTPAESVVIHNGVDLHSYSPHGEGSPPGDRWRLLMVEGSLLGGYEQGLQAAVSLALRLVELIARAPGGLQPKPVELMVVGRTAEKIQSEWQARLQQAAAGAQVSLNFAGLTPRERIPSLDRSAHLLYSSDIHPACPNSVIEALACGLPVAAFDTGALSELVRGDAGRIVPYGGDPWKLDQPDVPTLANAVLELLSDQTRFRAAARAHAVAAFDLERMVDSYLEVLSV